MQSAAVSAAVGSLQPATTVPEPCHPWAGARRRKIDLSDRGRIPVSSSYATKPKPAGSQPARQNVTAGPRAVQRLLLLDRPRAEFAGGHDQQRNSRKLPFNALAGWYSGMQRWVRLRRHLHQGRQLGRVPLVSRLPVIVWFGPLIGWFRIGLLGESRVLSLWVVDGVDVPVFGASGVCGA